ncbi:hypothetical protein G6F24_014663 [Rhizopus arrhizus]|nr:hypothetical protein G6F24_014663 [Rhizopus arrhizus]
MEDDDLVDAVEELGAEVSAQHVHHLGLGLLVFLAGGATGLQPTLDDVRAQVRGGDDDGIGEIHHPALAVGEPPVVEYLQQDVVDVGVRFFDLIEQQHAVGFATHLLGELAALVIAHITRRRAHQACHGMAFTVLGHVDAQQRALIAIDGLGQCLGEFGLAHTRRPEEQEGGHWLAAFAQARARQPHGIGHGTYCFVLAHQALVQPLLQMQQLLAFFHRQLVDRNAGQARDDLRDMLGLDFGAARGALASAALSYCLREAT